MVILSYINVSNQHSMHPQLHSVISYSYTQFLVWKQFWLKLYYSFIVMVFDIFLWICSVFCLVSVFACMCVCLYTYSAKWHYTQGGSGNSDSANRLVDTVGEGEDGMNGERSVETHTHTLPKDFRRNSLVELLWELKAIFQAKFCVSIQ